LTHWTEELFVKHPDLFLKALEELIVEARHEVEILLRRLGEQGYAPQNVLDLNCGIGRHSIELGKKGVNVLGTDLSPLYIEIATKRAASENLAKKVRFKKADMRNIAPTLKNERPFDGIVNLYTSFGFYDDKTNAGILRQCTHLVRPGGFFALEIIKRDWIVRNFQEKGFTCFEGLIVLENREFNKVTSRMRSTWTHLLQKKDRSFVPGREITLDHRIWSLHELIELFNENGWSYKSVHPGFGRLQTDAPTGEVHRFLFIAERKGRVRFEQSHEGGR
jgi:SAM-dependent methyltransferase